MSVGLIVVAGGVALLLTVFNRNLVFFYGPTELLEHKAQHGKIVRVGGLVVEGSIVLREGGATFKLTDGTSEIGVETEATLPSIFRDHQGAVAQGRFDGERFIATEVLTKHDENYMPPEVAKTLKEQGVWQGGEKLDPALLYKP